MWNYFQVFCNNYIFFKIHLQGVASQPYSSFFFFSPWVPNGGIDVLGFYLYVNLSGPDLIALRACVSG
jgi:hypothetical protein